MAPHSSTLAWKIPWTEEPGCIYQHMTIFNIAFCLKSSQYQLSFGWSFPAIEKFSFFFFFYHSNTMSFLYSLIFHNNFTFGFILSSSFGLYARSSSKCRSVLVFVSCSPVLSRHCKCKLTYIVLIQATWNCWEVQREQQMCWQVKYFILPKI